jgi:hypothetical protein
MPWSDEARHTLEPGGGVNPNGSRERAVPIVGGWMEPHDAVALVPFRYRRATGFTVVDFVPYAVCEQTGLEYGHVRPEIGGSVAVEYLGYHFRASPTDMMRAAIQAALEHHHPPEYVI